MDVDRKDPKSAEATFESLFPDAAQREGIIAALAADLEATRKLEPSTWSITLALDGRFIRLNVGRALVLSLEKDHILVTRFLPGRAAELKEPTLSGTSDEREGFFKSSSSLVWQKLDPAEFLAVWPTIREDHQRAFDEAAHSVKRTPYFYSHSDAVIAYLEAKTATELPRPDHPPVFLSRRQLDAVIERLRAAFPGWQGFEDSDFGAAEIEYKQRSSNKASERLSESELRELLSKSDHDEFIRRLIEVANSDNLLYKSTPRHGDLNILHQDGLDKAGFCRVFTELLYGAGDSTSRLERYLEWVEAHGLPNKWTFPTYYLFMLYPDSEMFVKPSITTPFVASLGFDQSFRGTPSPEAYDFLKELSAELMRGLEAFKPRDMVDIQSLMFVATKSDKKGALAPSLRREFEQLFAEFLSSYPRSKDGQRHIAFYQDSGAEARRNLDAINAARERGDDVTDEVLLKLLPHKDTQGNRARGAWLTHAPAINKDVRSFFEGAGWKRTEDWPEVARLILDFFNGCLERPEDLDQICGDFAASKLSKGLQAGMLTVTLNALRPDLYALINSKSLKTLNYFTNGRFGSAIADYPAVNSAFHALLADLESILDDPASPDLPPGDLLDMFSHWLVAHKGYPPTGGYWKVAPGEDAWQWEECLEAGFIGVGWEELGDVSGMTKAEFGKHRDRLARENEGWSADGTDQVWKFSRISEGDRIVANRGTREVLGIGTVTGPYYFVPDARYGHRLPVQWDDTRLREVDEGGWRRTLVKLSREKFEAILKGGGGPPPLEALFTEETFQLLSGLNENPTKDYYSQHKDAIKHCVEAPLQDLLAAVAEGLPTSIKEVMETEKKLFSRILKNDYGRGGAWDHYWGAFYPSGGQRIADAQLYVSVSPGRLDYGFSLGEYGGESEETLLRNLRENRHALPALLKDTLSDARFLFGERQDLEEGESAHDLPNNRLDWRKWLQDPSQYGIDVRTVLTSTECLGKSKSDLVADVTHAFRSLFPLVLLATSQDPVPEIEGYLETPRPRTPAKKAYSLEECADTTGFELATLEAWSRAIHRKGQAVFYGPPGTGKTFIAERLAQHLVGGGTGFSELVQFHPAYAYEDFIQGIRPRTTPGGGLTYDIQKGRFINFCLRARREQDICVLIIDEINRANLARVFGELMYLLEYRDQEVPLAGGGSLKVPENVRIIGTMNTADRSIALVDHALRRRFAFLQLRPQPKVLERFHERERTGFDPSGLLGVLDDVNREIGDPNYAVGITFFLRKDLDDHLEDIWRMEIHPYLEEFFFDQSSKVEKFSWEKVAGRMLG